MDSSLTDYDLKVLRTFLGNKCDDLVWGEQMQASLDRLLALGLATQERVRNAVSYTITVEGRRAARAAL